MKKQLSFFFLLGSCTFLFSQTISGKIEDESRYPIQEVNILNKTTGAHTHSNEKGDFLLENCKEGDILQISFNGYQTELFEVKSISEHPLIVLYKKTTDIHEVQIPLKIDALHIITDIDIQTNPVNSSQDILRKIPGLFIGQHAGGGKAEQIFLRGFDIDHGTDISVTVDGLPVNMVSHAHGQGYADLHFVIPETIDKIDFGKGPYYENKGNFTTSGYVNFLTKKELQNSSIKLEAGQFNTYRFLGMFNILNQNNQDAYIATEFLSTDGFFVSPQNFNRINIFGKYNGAVNNKNKIGVTVSYFDSKWDASGQIPQRAVDSGLITRFGAIDDKEGGSTSRKNILFTYDKIITENSIIKNKIFLNEYNFELYSNFTFFLEDPINGDQIKQKENRLIYGFNSEYNKAFSDEKIKGNWQAGISLRNDQINDNELSHTLNRTTVLHSIKLGDINETNLAAYAGTDITINKWTFNPSVRLDYFDFQYNDKLSDTYKTQEENKATVSPKLNILYTPLSKIQLYLKMGKGFHSNDTRVVVEQKGHEILPAAYGFDAGFIWKPTPKMLFNFAYWYLYLKQEFVYVGDEGIVEPSGKTRRQGFDLSYRYQPFSWMYWNVDANYTHARSIEAPKGQNYIPLAPDFTFVSGLNFIFKSGLYGGLNLRHLGNRPANEDYSITAKGYTVADFNIGYRWKSITLGIQVQNLFNTVWNETQFATESRLQNEPNSIEEIHFTPGTPFFLKGMIQYNF